MNRCALLAAGCATNGNQATVASEDKEYVTGSRIPIKNNDKSGARATSDRNTIDDMLRRGGNATGGTGGGGS